MGLIYDPADFSSLVDALKQNLTHGRTVLSRLESGGNRLVASLSGGDLSGKGYGAVRTLFQERVAASITAQQEMLAAVARDLDAYVFTVDTAVDLGAAAAAAGIGAAAGSFILPPIGTVIGAGVGLGVNFLMNAKWFGGKSIVDGAKDVIKDGLDWLQSKFW